MSLPRFTKRMKLVLEYNPKCWPQRGCEFTAEGKSAAFHLRISFASCPLNANKKTRMTKQIRFPFRLRSSVFDIRCSWLPLSV